MYQSHPIQTEQNPLMSPENEQLLVVEIVPRIRGSVANSGPQVGADDVGEFVQDGIAIAATLLASAEARGKQVSAGNVSYYATKLVRQGRRSTGQSTTDVMSPTWRPSSPITMKAARS